MDTNATYLTKGFLAALVFLAISCSGPGSTVFAEELVLVGSTPGDAEIRSLLSINAQGKIDFIRWELRLSEGEPKKYALEIHYGEGQPNTLGFKGGGEKLTLQGSYMVSKEPRGNVYELKNNASGKVVSLLSLNGDLFHILRSNKALMVGNGGWSYTLNRKEPQSASSSDIPTLITSVLNDNSAETVFDGRTPCAEIVRNYEIPIQGDCFKLKWRLVLRRDPSTGRPAGYSLYRTQHRQSAIEGTWIVQKGIPANPEAIVYRLDPERPGSSPSFLVGDDNVLFFLDKEFRLFTGNEDFSFTLNRKPS